MKKNVKNVSEKNVSNAKNAPVFGRVLVNRATKVEAATLSTLVNLYFDAANDETIDATQRAEVRKITRVFSNKKALKAALCKMKIHDFYKVGQTEERTHADGSAYTYTYTLSRAKVTNFIFKKWDELRDAYEVVLTAK